MRKWVKIEDGLLIKALLRNYRLDGVLFEINNNFIIGDRLIVMGGNEGSVHADWNHGITIVVVFDNYLGFTIRSQPWASVILADFSEAST